MTIPRRRMAHIVLSRELINESRADSLEWQDVSVRTRGALAVRECGMAFLTWAGEIVFDEERLTRFCLALARSIGVVLPETRNTDGRELTATPTVQISLSASDERPKHLRHFANPNLDWPLHTDRALHQNVGDFLIVCKLQESGGSGGEIRLLHLDDWPQFDRFSNAPFSRIQVAWKGDPQMAPVWLQSHLQRELGVFAPVFDDHERLGTTIRFTDSRFRTASSLEHFGYLADIARDLQEHAQRMPCFRMPVGSLYVVNNRLVLHGRRGFRTDSTFRRKLLRICGDLDWSHLNH